MIRKTMSLGEYAAEFHIDPESDPPQYSYVIIQRNPRTLLCWANASSLPEVLRMALEQLERYHLADPESGDASDPALKAA